jgi:hypothetical protein
MTISNNFLLRCDTEQSGRNVSTFGRNAVSSSLGQMSENETLGNLSDRSENLCRGTRRQIPKTQYSERKIVVKYAVEYCSSMNIR